MKLEFLSSKYFQALFYVHSCSYAQYASYKHKSKSAISVIYTQHGIPSQIITFIIQSLCRMKRLVVVELLRVAKVEYFAQNQNCTCCTFDSRRLDADLELQSFESHKMKAFKERAKVEFSCWKLRQPCNNQR